MDPHKPVMTKWKKRSLCDMFAVLLWQRDVRKVGVCASYNKQQFVWFVCVSDCAARFLLGKKTSDDVVPVKCPASVQLLHLCNIKMNAGVCTSLLSVSFRGR